MYLALEMVFLWIALVARLGHSWGVWLLCVMAGVIALLVELWPGEKRMCHRERTLGRPASWPAAKQT